MTGNLFVINLSVALTKLTGRSWPTSASSGPPRINRQTTAMPRMRTFRQTEPISAVLVPLTGCTYSPRTSFMFGGGFPVDQIGDKERRVQQHNEEQTNENQPQQVPGPGAEPVQ